MYRTAIVLLTLALVHVPAARAGGKTPPQKVPPAVAELLRLSPDEFLARFDKNKDGVLTKDELPPYLGKAFDSADANGDGKLNRTEVVRMLQVIRTFFSAGQPKAAPDVEALVNKLLLQFDK